MLGYRIAACALSILTCLVFCNSAESHFLWLVPQDESGARVELYFSEAPEPGNPKLLQKLKELKAEAYRGDKDLETQSFQFVNDQGTLLATSKGATAWHLKHTYGVHGTDQKSLLIYSASCVTCERDGMDEKDSVHLPLQGFTLRPALEGNSLSLSLFRDGKPAKGFEFELHSPKEHRSFKTNEMGVAIVETPTPGVFAVRCLTTDKTPGVYEGAAYEAVSHYTTVSFIVPNLNRATLVPEDVETLGALPEAITSFGAAAVNNSIFAYGGNTGGAHSYSNDQQFNKLIRLDLKNNRGWEAITEGPRVQGNALVSHGTSVILVGGFTATNAKGEKSNLVSQSKVQRFDLTSGKWSDLPNLPEPRSSMDAIALDGYLYAIGGWNMKGNSDAADWHKTAWRLSLETAEASWEPIAAPPFQRRAVAVAAHKDRVFVIGGMEEDGETTTASCAYDPKSNSWENLSPIAGVPMTGFGTSAATVGNDLIVSTVDGSIQRYDDARSKWEIIGQIPTGRFFHRIVPISDKAFAMIGGANMSVGKFKDTPIVKLITQN